MRNTRTVKTTKGAASNRIIICDQCGADCPKTLQIEIGKQIYRFYRVEYAIRQLAPYCPACRQVMLEKATQVIHRVFFDSTKAASSFITAGNV